MPWYRTGTASFTNGSTAVTGLGTAWNANVASGEALLGPDGKVYEIGSIGSDTAITLGSAYLGITAAGQPYVIAPTQSYLRDLAASVAALVASYSSSLATVVAGRFGDGNAATPGITFSNDQDTGWFKPAGNVVALSTGGVERLRVDSNGHMGVGAAPTAFTRGTFKIVDGSNALGLAGDTKGIRFEARPAGFNIRGVDNTLSGSYQPITLGGSTTRLDYNGETQGLLLDASGIFGVGVVVPGVWAPSAKAFQYTYASNGMDGVGGYFASFNLRESAAGVWSALSTDECSLLQWGTDGSIRFANAAVTTVGTTASLVERFRIDASGNTLLWAQAVPPALVANQQLVMNLTSNTNLRVSVRGTDGLTRVVNLTLA